MGNMIRNTMSCYKIDLHIFGRMLYLLFFGMVFFTGIAQGQPQIRAGVKIGVAGTGLNGTEPEMVNQELLNTKRLKKGGLVAGVYFNSMSEECLWIKHEVYYVNKGMQYKDTLVNGAMKELREALHYIDVYPLNITVLLRKRWQLFAGPFTSIYLGRKAQYLVENRVEVTHEAEAGENGRNLFEFGYNIGIEYEFFNGINLGFRYVSSLASLNDHRGKSDCNNQSIFLTLGYTLGKKQIE